MKGFEISINGQQVSAALELGVLTLVISKVTDRANDVTNLELAGMDSITGKHLTWKSVSLTEGDEVKLRFKHIEGNSPVLSEKEPQTVPSKEQKLKKFLAMKDALEKEGILPV